MKNVGTIIFTVLVVCAATTFAISSTWGTVSSKDKILLSERVFNYTSPYGISRNVQFPKYGKTNKVKITGIQAIDYASNATASWSTLIAGGPGFTYATLQFQSKANKGLDYQLVIYGK